MKLTRIFKPGERPGFWQTADGQWDIVRPFSVDGECGLHQARQWQIKAYKPEQIKLLANVGLLGFTFPTRRAAVEALELLLS